MIHRATGSDPSDSPVSASSAPPPSIAVYADESCLGNGREGENPGGAAGLIEWYQPGRAVVRRDYWLSEPATTNNRMALRSAIEAFRILSAKGNRLRVFFTSDSEYLVRGMTTWVRDWAARNWRRKGGAILNLELWQELVEVASHHEHAWRWVRGHAEHPQNEYANDLAVRAARELSSSGGAVASGFDEWLKGARERGRMRTEPDGSPEAGKFRRGATLPGVSESRLL
jgi:ribonuclease HI